MVQISNRLNPILEYLSCFVEIGGPVKNRSLNATTAIMSHDDDVADVKVRHAVRDD